MNRFDTQLMWCGTMFEIQVFYNIDDDLNLEIERADLIGVYMPGDMVKKGDYTPLGVDVPLWGKRMPNWLYDELMTETEEFLLTNEKDGDYEA